MIAKAARSSAKQKLPSDTLKARQKLVNISPVAVLLSADLFNVADSLQGDHNTYCKYICEP